MAKVRSLDHTRFVITGTGTSTTEKARTLYYAGNYREAKGQIADWCTDLGGAEVFTNLHAAQKIKKGMEECHTSTIKHLGRDKFVNFHVKLVDRKEIMVARLKYNPEEI